MKKMTLFFIAVLCCLFSCKNERSIDGVWRKTIGSQKLFVYEIDGSTGFVVMGRNDKTEMIGLFDWVNDSVCNVINRKGENLGKATFHSSFKSGNSEAMFVDGFYDFDAWSKDKDVDEEETKVIKATLSIILPEIKEKMK